ncbi:MAG: TonB-dependent receptor, partial [Bacteroidota bacterium]
NPFGLDAATAGGQSNAQPISLDAIEQITVNLAPYDVTQAGFTGAAVNAVTKSGTNDFHGTVYGFWRNQDLTGSRVDGDKIFVPELTQFQTGASLGGPIIKDKLFFFANFEIERRDDLGSNFIASRAGTSGDQVSRVDAADLDLVRQTLLNRFDYETGEYEGYLHATDNEKGLLKLDWNIAPGHTLAATYNFLSASRDNNAHPNAISRRGPDATTLQFRNSGYRINNNINSGKLELNSLFSDKASNKLQVGYTAYRDSRDPFSVPFPSILIQENGVNYIVAGHEPFSINNNLDQDVFQITNNFQYFTGRHSFTVGVSFERFAFDNSFNLGAYPGAFGPFLPGASSVQTFVDAVNAGELDASVELAETAFETGNGPGNGYQGTGWALAETNVGQLGLYIQDEINVTSNFTLTLGLRFDKPLYFDTEDKIRENIELRACCYDPELVYFDTNNEEIQFDHTVLPNNDFLISPRLGINWDVRGDRSLQFRGGTGLFTGRFPFVWVGNQVANPNDFFYSVTNPEFQWPQVWRTNLGMDIDFGKGFVFSSDFILTKEVNSMIVNNYGLRNPSGTLAGVDGRPVYTVDDRVQRFDFFAQGLVDQNAYVFDNAAVNGRGINISLELKRNWANGLYTSLAYNFLDKTEASSIEAEISGDAYDRNPAFGNVSRAVLSPSLYGNRHRIVGSLNKRFAYAGDKLATSIGLFFQYAQGGRFSYTYSGDINRDGSSLNDLILIPSESQLAEMNFVSEDQRRAYGNFIEQDEYLRENRGRYAERYAILSPWFSNWDLRIAQDFKVGTDNNVQFTIDILNFGNLLSSEWGVRQFPTNTQPVGVSFNDQGEPVYSFDPELTSTFTNDFSLLSRWQMQ